VARPSKGSEPIRKRVSYTVPKERVKDVPSKKTIKQYTPLAEACIALVARNYERDHNCNIVAGIHIRVSFPNKAVKPSWMPTGRFTEAEGAVIMSLNPSYMLITLYEQRLTEVHPILIYKAIDSDILNVNSMLKEYDFGEKMIMKMFE
jgi:hypothetical protein